MSFGKLPRGAIGRKSPRKIVHHDQADGHVVQRHADPFGVFVRQQALKGAFVGFEGLRKTILAVQDVGDVQFQARQAQTVAGLLEDGARFAGAFERAGILA